MIVTVRPEDMPENRLNNSKPQSDIMEISDLASRFSFLFPKHDALSCVLETIHLHSAYLARPVFMATAPWGIHIPQGPAGFVIIPQGNAYVQVKGKEPFLLNQGDLLVIIRGIAHSLTDSPQTEAVPVENILPSWLVGKQQHVAFGGGGQPATLVCGCFFLKTYNHLLSVLPDIIHIRNDNGKPVKWLEGMLSLLYSESAADYPGTSIVLNHLAHLILIQAIRTYLTVSSSENNVWSDLVMSSEVHAALKWIQESPEKPWSVASLATKVGMSRSVFAARFTHLIGMPPMKYLLDYRMHKASILLGNNQNNLKQIALQVGYHSESAFSNAFKRWAKITPGLYRKSRIQNEVSG